VSWKVRHSKEVDVSFVDEMDRLEVPIDQLEVLVLELPFPFEASEHASTAHSNLQLLPELHLLLMLIGQLLLILHEQREYHL
jgi:hypothetical protein